MIQFDNVSFSYIGYEGKGSVQAVSDVTFSIPDGAHVVFLGRNGSGKSTIARLINGLLIPEKGRVLVDGLDTADDASIDEIRRRAGMVFQNPDNQIIGTTVADDVAFGPCNLGLPADEVRKRVAYVLERTGLMPFREREPYALSGGQKQKLAVASVLAMHPDILILDESTSMLDPSSRRALMELVLELKETERLTIVQITHHMDEAILADRVFVVSHGHFVMEGKPSEVFDDQERVLAEGLSIPTHLQIAHRLFMASGVPYDPDELISFDGSVDYVRRALRETGKNGKSDSLSVCAPASLPDPHQNDSLSVSDGESNVAHTESNTDPVIEVNHLSYSYESQPETEVHALTDVSLSVRRGEVLGIVGHTGSGKSTLIQHFNGIIGTGKGTVAVLGHDLSNRKVIRDIRKHVGLLFQYPEDQLFEETVALDIAFAPKQMGKSPENIARSVEKAAKRLGVDMVLDRSPFDLSGGQRRRAAIAGVLAAEPDILVLDEPAAGLDPAGCEALFDDLITLTEEGATLIIVSHDMEAMVRRCDRILVMKGGCVAKIGTPSEIVGSADFLQDASLEVPAVKRFLDAIAPELPGLCTFAFNPEGAAREILSAAKRNGCVFKEEGFSSVGSHYSDGISKNVFIRKEDAHA